MIKIINFHLVIFAYFSLIPQINIVKLTKHTMNGLKNRAGKGVHIIIPII
jgi:hypothetical protein